MKIKILFLFTFGLLILSGCKPTEKGYKSAYDAALGKRQAAMAELDVNLPEGAIQSVDGPQLKNVEGADVYLLNQRISPVEEEMKLPGNYNVVVGTYKMSTNCMAQSRALKEEGYEAFPAKATDGMYFTVAGSFSSMKEAVEFYKKYQAGKNRVYVGLPNAPVIIFSPK